MSANREIEDKVTKIMGSYLLKGYRLLDSHCQNCQTPLMRTKTSDVYCIYCNEIDTKSTETSHTNDANTSNVCSNERAMIGDIDRINDTKTKSTIDSLGLNTNTLDSKEDIQRIESIVQKKIIWATDRLAICDQINDCIQIINFIKTSADLLLTLNKLNQNQNTNQ